MTKRGPTIADTALALIKSRGPQDLDSITAAVVEAGRTRARDPRRAVDAAINIHPEFLRDWDGRWCSIVDQLDGTVISRRLTTLERRDDIVFMTDEMHLVERLALRGRPFRGGGELHLDYVYDYFELPWMDRDEIDADDEIALDADLTAEFAGFLRELGAPYDVDDEEAVAAFVAAMRETRLLHGPPGWLFKVANDELAGFTVKDGTIDVIPLSRRDVRGPHVALAGARIVALARRVIGPDPSWFGPPTVALKELLELVATDAPEILKRPLPPLGEVITRAGLEVVDGWVGHPGTAWGSPRPYPTNTSAEAWGFEPPSISS